MPIGLNTQTLTSQFDTQRPLVRRLEKPWTQMPMHFNSGTDYPVRDGMPMIHTRLEARRMPHVFGPKLRIDQKEGRNSCHPVDRSMLKKIASVSPSLRVFCLEQVHGVAQPLDKSPNKSHSITVLVQ